MENLINTNLVACMLGVTTKTIARWLKLKEDPLPVAIKGGKGQAHQFDIATVHQWGIRQYTKGANPNGEVYDYLHERARLTHLQADKAELENQVTRGELIPAPVVGAVWTQVILNARARILAMPTRIAHAVVAVDTVPEAHEIVRSACYEALTELANNEFESTSRSGIEKIVRELQPCDEKQATPPSV